MNKKFFASGIIALSFIAGSVSSPVNANDSGAASSSTIVSQKNTNNIQVLNAGAITTQSTIIKKMTTTSLNMRTGASTKYRVIKTLKKNTTVDLTGSKSGSWVKIKSGSSTGWVSDSYLKNIPAPKKKVVSGGNSEEARTPTSTEQRDWKSTLPSACKAVKINSIQIKGQNSSRWSLSFSTRTTGTEAYYTLRITGNIKASHPAASALMKHECGHVLAGIYIKGKGGNAYTKFMNTGWKSNDNMRGEKLADCIADQLGAKRQQSGKSSYKVGYGTVCSSKQKSVAKTITTYGKNKRY